MKFSHTALSVLVAARSVSAFSTTNKAAFSPRSVATYSSSASALHASVLKLSDPAKEILDKVDVFIFDCDGVIWRVRKT
jgi:4-nitrophenyl phosphatase/phosphoglycolate phosphatase